MNDIDATSPAGQVMASNSTTPVTIISSLADLAEAFPEYTGTVTMPPTYIGLDEENPPEWEQDEYEFKKRVVAGRVLAAIEDCVALVPNDDAASDILSPLTPQPFGGIVVGQGETPVESSSNTVTVSNLQYLLVLYSSALLVMQYERELSTRVLGGATDSTIAAINRKFTKGKRELRRRLTRKGHTGELAVPLNGVTVYDISLGDDVSKLVDP